MINNSYLKGIMNTTMRIQMNMKKLRNKLKNHQHNKILVNFSNRCLRNKWNKLIRKHLQNKFSSQKQKILEPQLSFIKIATLRVKQNLSQILCSVKCTNKINFCYLMPLLQNQISISILKGKKCGTLMQISEKIQKTNVVSNLNNLIEFKVSH